MVALGFAEERGRIGGSGFRSEEEKDWLQLVQKKKRSPENHNVSIKDLIFCHKL